MSRRPLRAPDCRTFARGRSRFSARCASFVGTITPSSETATDTASSGTTAVSRNVDSGASRFASQRALSPLGKRSSEFFDSAVEIDRTYGRSGSQTEAVAFVGLRSRMSAPMLSATRAEDALIESCAK